MNINNTLITNPERLTSDELLEEYEKLSESYAKLKIISEDNLQNVYELKRSLQTTKAAESYLSYELENISSIHALHVENLNKKHQTSLNELRECQVKLSSEKARLEIQNTELQETVSNLKEILEAQTAMQVKELTKPFDLDNEVELEQHNIKMKNEIIELTNKIYILESSNAEIIRDLKCEREAVQCLESNLETKNMEIMEKSLQIDSLHEKLIEYTIELNEIKNNASHNNQKGNSLFAEVDDQRQEMKNILRAQKLHYLQMQKLYTEGESEIRRLKLENAAMHREMQVCSSLFMKADDNYKIQLNERIEILRLENIKLQQKHLMYEEKLVELAKDKGILWLESMLIFCRNAEKDLKTQLYNCLMKKTLLEDNFKYSQQELAKWRFEALKSRCIIINREHLLQENKIPFSNVDIRNVQINENDTLKSHYREPSEQQHALPIEREDSLKPSKIPDIIDISTSSESSQQPSIEDSNTSHESITTNHDSEIIQLTHIIKNNLAGKIDDATANRTTVQNKCEDEAAEEVIITEKPILKSALNSGPTVMNNISEKSVKFSNITSTQMFNADVTNDTSDRFKSIVINKRTVKSKPLN